MVESRNFYLNLPSKVRDYMLDVFEASDDVRIVQKKLRDIGSPKLHMDDIREALVMSYSDGGESEIAIELARIFNEQSPTPNMHNLVLKVMLGSWSYTQQRFLDESCEWARRYAEQSEETLGLHHHERPRVGLVCDYGSTVFGANAIFPMAGGLIENGLDVYYYNFEDREYNASGDHFIIANVHALTSHQLSERIRHDQIDVLIDLNGRLRDHHRLGVFCRRSAPIQVNYFNLVGTMGMKNYDYMIVDDVQVPVADERYYLEKAIRLPCGVNGAFSFTRDVEISIPDKGASEPFIFASFNAFFKINTLLLEAWAEILQRAPHSKLVIKCAETERDRVIRKIAGVFGKRNVDMSRIIIDGWSSLDKMRRQYGKVDLCLDTFPYSGGSTTLNALWQGVPVLTWCGDGWRARSSASMLTAAGLEELVVFSREDYIEQAVALAEARSRVTAMRRHLAGTVAENRYFRPDIVYVDLARALACLCETAGKSGVAAPNHMMTS